MSDVTNHLLEITKAIGRIEATLDSIEKQSAAHDKSDTYYHKKLDDNLVSINDRLDDYNNQLVIHIARTEQVEEELSKLKPLREASTWLGVSLKGVAIVGSVVGVVKMLGLLD